jgi:hypothetical protein
MFAHKGEVMNRFRDELKVIPVPAWILAAALYVAIAIGCFQFFGQNYADPAGKVLRAILTLSAPLLIVWLPLLIGYIYADAKRRGMRYVVWTLLAIFVPNLIGILLYFLLREPLSNPCRSCGDPKGAAQAYCPSCGAASGRVCPQCGRGVQPGWKNCVNCGTNLG